IVRTLVQSLYCLRFLNCLLLSILVSLGYVIARTLGLERLGLSIGVPLLLAFMPQDVLYVLSNDVLSPVCFAVLFVCVLQWLPAESPGLLLGAMAGLAIAASYLTNVRTLPLVPVARIALEAKWSPM